jgi:WD40 repeat protein
MVRFINQSSDFFAAGQNDGILSFYKKEDKKHTKETWTRYRTIRREGDIYDFHILGSSILLPGLFHHTLLYHLISPTSTSHTYVTTDQPTIHGVAIDPLKKYLALQSSSSWVRIYSFSSPHRVIATLSPGLYKEESLFTFIRRLAWTHDGDWLFIPAGIGEVTYVYKRNQWNKAFGEYKHLGPSIAVRMNPILYQPYLYIIAILTQDSLVIIGMSKEGIIFGAPPLFYEKRMHKQLLTDIAWSNDGKQLFLVSLDGYLSFLSIDWKEGGWIPRIEEEKG